MKARDGFLWWATLWVTLDAAVGLQDSDRGYTGFQSPSQLPSVSSSGYGRVWSDDGEEFWTLDDDSDAPSYSYYGEYSSAEVATEVFSEVYLFSGEYPTPHPGESAEYTAEASIIEPYHTKGEATDDDGSQPPPQIPLPTFAVGITTKAPTAPDVPPPTQPSGPVANPRSFLAPRLRTAPTGPPPPGPLEATSVVRTCVYVCLMNVACSGNSRKCHDRVFISGSFWCRFFSECPTYDPAFTVIYIPYKPVGAPFSPQHQFVTGYLSPLSPAPAPGSLEDDGDFRDGGDSFAPLPQPVAIAATFMPSTASGKPHPVSASFLAPVSVPVAMAQSPSNPETELARGSAAFSVSSAEPVASSRAAFVDPAEMPAKKSSKMTVVPDVPEPLQDAEPLPQPAFPPAPADPQCFYVCTENLCDASTCRTIKPGVCTFWSHCPPDVPYQRVIELPLQAETDPPGTWVPVDPVQSVLASGR